MYAIHKSEVADHVRFRDLIFAGTPYDLALQACREIRKHVRIYTYPSLTLACMPLQAFFPIADLDWITVEW